MRLALSEARSHFDDIMGDSAAAVRRPGGKEEIVPRMLSDSLSTLAREHDIQEDVVNGYINNKQGGKLNRQGWDTLQRLVGTCFFSSAVNYMESFVEQIVQLLWLHCKGTGGAILLINPHFSPA